MIAFFRKTSRLPGAVPGMLLFLAALSAPAQIELARELFAERDYAFCFVEAERVLAETQPHPEAALLSASAYSKLSAATNRLCLVESLINDDTIPLDTRLLAAYECGRTAWESDSHTKAFDLMSFCFLHANSDNLRLKSACSLFSMLSKHPKLLPRNSPIRLEIAATSTQWDSRLMNECSVKSKRPGILSLPGRVIVALYRRNVSPAIGQRCIINPSCSEYFRQASIKHGLLGVPMQADRFIREPDLIQAGFREDSSGSRTIPDPLSDHDFWMEK